MKPTLLTTSLFAASLCALSQARPLIENGKREPEPIPQSYSVVPVDGGSTVLPTTKTVTNAMTQTQFQTSLVTVVSTVTVGGVASPTTIIVPTTVVVDVPVTVTASPSVAIVSPSQITDTVTVEPSVTSIPYDNGQWHTTYFHVSTIDTVGPSSPVSSSPLASSTAVEAALATSSTTVSVSVITPSPEVTTSTLSSASATSTDWATYYGTWR